MSMSMSVMLLLLDDNVNQSVQTRLHTIVSDVSVFSNLDDCVNEIVSTSSGSDNVLLIVSDSFCQNVGLLIDALPQLRAIYIYCFDTSQHIAWATQYDKIGANRVFSEENDLIMQLAIDLNVTTTQTFSPDIDKNETRFIRRDESLMFTVFASNKRNNTTSDLTEEKITFIWVQQVTNVLIHMPKLEKEARNDMIIACCQERKDKVKSINEFHRIYTPDDAIRWYTNPEYSYLCHLLNQALRTQNFDIIFKFRAFIADIYKQIKQLFETGANNTSKQSVYRGQQMTESELNRLRDSVGGLISMNSFLSTSKSEQVACLFIDNIELPPGNVAVLFELTIDPLIAQTVDTPFADIKRLTNVLDEEEILLSIGTIFRINEIKSESLNRTDIWRIKGSMCSIDDEPQIKMLFDYAKDNICSQKTMTFSTYGKLLAFMSNYNSSIAYQQQLLAQLPSDHSDLPTVHNDLAYAYRESGQYLQAHKHYEIALKLKESRIPREPCDDIDLATTYSDFGWLLMVMGNSVKSFERHHQAVYIREKYLGDDHVDTAMSYECLGRCYLDKEDFETAHHFLQKALAIRKRRLPPYHPYLAMSYSSLGSYYDAVHDHVKALKMYKEALCIYKYSLPPTHKLLVATYVSVSLACPSTRHWEEAIEHLTKTLIIHRKSDSDEQADTLNYLGFAYFNLGDFKQALVFDEEALYLARKTKNYELVSTIEESIENIKKILTAEEDY